MHKLYFNPCHYSVPDNQTEIEALKLKDGDLYTSNELVILAARALVNENKLEPFFLVEKGKEYPVDKNGRFSRGYPDSLWEEYLDRLLEPEPNYLDFKEQKPQWL